MVKEPEVPVSRQVKIGDDKWDVVDRGAPISFVDVLAEARHANGVVYLSFAAGTTEHRSIRQLQIQSRLRMSVPTAQFLYGVLGNIIREAAGAADKPAAN